MNHISFQEILDRYFGAGHFYLASSARAALYLLLRRLREATDHPDRREVLLPAYTCPCLVTVVRRAELTPRLVDVSPHTLGFESGELERLISKRTLAVVGVHLFGIPQPIDNVLEMAKAVGAIVIEDAAQAMGARLGGRPVGTHGDFGLFSLGPGKSISTGGGGILYTGRDEYARLAEQAWAVLPQPSAALSPWALLRLFMLGLAFHPFVWWLVTRLKVHRLADHMACDVDYPVRGLTAAQTGVGVALMARLDAINDRRRANARHLISQLVELDSVRMPSPVDGANPIYLRLPVILSDVERRERAFRHLWRAGIGVGRMYRRTLPELFPDAFGGTRCPGAEYVASHLLTLPTHHYLSKADLGRIVRVFQSL